MSKDDINDLPDVTEAVSEPEDDDDQNQEMETDTDDMNPYADRSYAVGKGKPPVHSRFKPGQSGNPNRGPNRSPKTFTACLRIEAEKTITLSVNGKVEVMTKMEAAAAATMIAAMKGNSNALKQLQRLDGGGFTAEELMRVNNQQRNLIGKLKDKLEELESRRTGVLAIPAPATHPLDTRMMYESPNKILAELLENPELLLEFIKSKKILISTSEEDEEPPL